MNPGDLLLKLAFTLSLASAALFLPALRGKRTFAASWAFAAQALALVAAAGLLWHYFLAHRFDYEYVARYSSRALPLPLALSASWAGQEGSILLWATLGALLGLALLRQPGTLTRPAMFFTSATQFFLLLLLLVKSPFARSHVIPPDGQGLNPLLEDPWMVVHPPVLFVGYAALATPFALAAAALVRREYREWNRMVWPWVLFALVSLGAGIALGGVWAYKVLGWGGFWGWDPVENASLVPWLVVAALLHGLLIQRTTGALARTNLLLALLAWATVLGGTYLTRSGALQDFSVHSFTDAGLNAPLSAFLLGSLLLGAGLLLARWDSVEARPANWMSLSRESALWLGMITVLVLTGLVAFGTTVPLLTRLAGAPASVQARFYHLISVPLGIALVLLMGLAPALRWSRQHGMSWLAWLAPGLVAGALAAAVAALAGMREPGHLALTALAGLALAVNAVMTVRLFRRGWAYGAGYLGHVGIAVMVIGMVVSSSLGRSERLRLVEGQPAQALGYTLTYHGEQADPRGQHMLMVRVEKPGWSFDARPRLFPSPQGEGTIRKPALAQRGELYLSPMEVVAAPPPADGPTWLDKGQELELAGVGYTFSGFRMVSEKGLTVFADIEVRKDGRSVTVAPALQVGAGGSQPVDAQVDGLGALSLAKIDADHGRVAVRLPAASAARSMALVELSTKPLINLVWIGALLALVGSVLAGLHRAAEKAPARTAPRQAARNRQAHPTPRTVQHE